MAKILIVISGDIYVRNYLTTDALSAIEDNFDCHFIADQTVSLKQYLEAKPGFQGFYSIDASAQRKHELLFNMLMWRHRKKSRTFLYRWLRNSQWHLVDRSHGFLIYLMSMLRWFVSATLNPRGLIIPLLANRFVFPLTAHILQKQIPLNAGLETLIKNKQYAAVIFPSAAFDAVSVDIPRVCEPLKIPSLCLIDNWDNLSSKTVFWAKPSHIGVWGPQAREQAERIHRFDAHQIHEIGTPRFDQYFAARSQPMKAQLYDFPYVLFVGSAMPFDELAALKVIDASIQNSSDLPTNLHVVYRPHPWQQKRAVASKFVETDFRRVLLDKQINDAHEAGFEQGLFDTSFQPDLDYYPALLQNATCVVGPLTTMLLEGALCQRPVVAINYSDRVHRNTSRRYFSHFDGAENIPGFSFCDSERDLGTLIREGIVRGPISAEESDQATAYFLHRSPIPYPKRLLKLIQSISG